MVNTQLRLYNLGVKVARLFCERNGLPQPNIRAVPKSKWMVDACAFYRPDTEVERKYTLPGHVAGINVCVELCQHPAGFAMSRNWSWPGNAVDRTPYGVVCHELGHHVDWCVSKKKGRYYGSYSHSLHKQMSPLEDGLTSYAETNPAEYFAEAFRLFVTNMSLLAELRPKTCALIAKRFTPVSSFGAFHWRKALGLNCPSRIVKSLENKGAAPLPPRLDTAEWFASTLY